MSAYDEACERLRSEPKRWLVTGAAGFIGSNLLERLLQLGQHVIGVDNFVTGHRSNLEAARDRAAHGGTFTFLEGDICEPALCAQAIDGVDFVLHQAALGSVPRSLEDPLASHAANVDGFLNLLAAARKSRVARFVYASSSSVYGSDTSPMKSEDQIGQPLSPYAATKWINEIYADVFARVYELDCIGLRYFNVFGPRQDPNGPYAAVIPRWTQQLLSAKPCLLFGDGDKSRDFCYVANVVQANLLAAMANIPAQRPRVFNVACGERTTLNRLFELIRDRVANHRSSVRSASLQARPPLTGDIPHSLADITRARQLLGYEPTHDISKGLDEAVAYYVARAHAEPLSSMETADSEVLASAQ